MSAQTLHRLEGLEPDNLLAFMALLGLLRALETAESAWRPRAFWDETRHPLRPTLTLAQAQTREKIAEAAARGVSSWAPSLSNVVDAARTFDQENGVELRKAEKQLELTKTTGTLKKVRAQFKCGREELWHSVFATRGKDRKGADIVEQTPFMFPTAQMAFVGALGALSARPIAKEIEDALFSRWLYQVERETLRFSPAEARRWALQAGEPADDGAMSVRGANSLAAIGLLSYPMFERRGYAAVPGMHRERDEVRFWWPIWTSPANKGASLGAIESIVRMGMNEAGRALMSCLGVSTIFEARRFRLIPNQRYLNVDWAVARQCREKD